MEKLEFSSLLCSLEGFKTKFLELHWNSKLKSEHILCDNIISEINIFQDNFAEQGFTIFGKLNIGEFTSDSNFSQTIIEALNELLQLVIETKISVSDNVKFCSLSALCDEMVGKIRKSIYLSGLK